jgi:hypothetical protein
MVPLGLLGGAALGLLVGILTGMVAVGIVVGAALGLVGAATLAAATSRVAADRFPTALLIALGVLEVGAFAVAMILFS